MWSLDAAVKIYNIDASRTIVINFYNKAWLKVNVLIMNDKFICSVPIIWFKNDNLLIIFFLLILDISFWYI